MTGGLLRFQARLAGPCGLLGLSSASLFFFPGLSPLIPRCGASGGFCLESATEIARVLFYLPGIRSEFPLQPTAGSGMSYESPLTSPLQQLLIPLSLVIFLYFLVPSPRFYLFFPPSPSARPFRGASQARGRRACECQTSQNAHGQHKELLWRWAQICLNWICSLS